MKIQQSEKIKPLQISGHIHNNQEANLLYRYQLSYEKAKKGRSTEIECLYRIKSPNCACYHKLKISNIMSTGRYHLEINALLHNLHYRKIYRTAEIATLALD
jgi:hypothetical protein